MRTRLPGEEISLEAGQRRRLFWEEDKAGESRDGTDILPLRINSSISRKISSLHQYIQHYRVYISKESCRIEEAVA